MGMWDFISWSTESVKGVLQSSYDNGCAAITKVNKVVTVDAVEKVNHHLFDPQTRSKISRVATDLAKNATIEGLKTIPAITKVNKVVTVDAVEKVNHHLSDPQTRSKISRVATDLAKNATIEGLKTIPGAYPTYKIVSKSLSDDEKSKDKNKSKEQEDFKTLLATVSKLEKEVSVLREQAAIRNQAAEMNPQNNVQPSDKPYKSILYEGIYRQPLLVEVPIVR